MNSVLFSCTSLLGANKAGKLKKTEDGYYRMIVGSLDCFNSAGAFYGYQEAKSLFEESSQFMRRVGRGALRGEYGHPTQGSMDRDQFAARCMTIDEKSVCCHHRSIELDFDNVKDERGRPVIAIMSELRPDGPYGEYLEKALDNPSANVCFSIRAFTADSVKNGIKQKALKSIITWDMVNEPGLAIAEKFKSPALETHEEKVFSRGSIERAVRNSGAEVGMGLESSVIVTAKDLFRSMGWVGSEALEHAFLKAPGWKNW